MSPGLGARFPGPGLRDPWDSVPDADPWRDSPAEFCPGPLVFG